MQSRLQERFQRRPLVAALVLAVAACGLVVVDAVRLSDAGDRVGAGALALAVVVGAVAGLAAVAALRQLVSSSRGGWLLAAALLWLVLFGVTHPRRSSDAVTSATEAALLAGVDAVVVAGAAALVVALVRKRRDQGR